MKRFMALIVVVLMMLCLCAVASAESVSTRDSDYFNSYGATLSTTGSGKINITFSCTSVGTASQLGVSTYSVYRYTDDGWLLVAGPLNGSSSYNTNIHSFAKTFNGVAGEKYRVSCTFFCVKSGTSESKGYTSRSVTAK